MFTRIVPSILLFPKTSVIKFQIFILIMARVIHILSIRTPLGFGGGGGI